MDLEPQNDWKCNKSRFHSIPRQPAPVLCHPPSKIYFLMFTWNLLCFSSCWLLFFSVTGHHWKSLSRSAFFKHSPSDFGTCWTVPGLPASPHRKETPLPKLSFAGLCVAAPCLSYTWKPRSGCRNPGGEQRGRITCLNLLAVFCLMQPGIRFLGVKDTLLAHVQLVVHQYPQTLFCKALQPERHHL